MRYVFAVLLALPLGACESASERVVRMEMQDDAACQRLSAGKGPEAYTACRQNLMIYRREVARENGERMQAIGEGLQNAGAALSSIGR
jgi:hypothetical protein